MLLRVADQLPAIDSTVILVVLIAALAIGAGGMLLAASNSSPSPSPTDSLTAVGPESTLGTNGGSRAPAPTPDVPPTRQPDTDQPTPSPAPTPTSQPTTTPTPEPTSEAPAALIGYVWPLLDARLTSPFGARSDGFVVIDGKRAHDGLDLATWCGDKVRAAHAGTVLYAGRKFDAFLGYSEPMTDFYSHISNLNSLPIVIVIDDGNGYRSFYVHLATAKVGKGDVVRAGEAIGLEGATGRATGCHLHYGLIRMDGAWQAVASVYLSLYPPFVRERVDPLLALPLRDPDAPAKIRGQYGQPDEPGLPFDPPAAGSPGN